MRNGRTMEHIKRRHVRAREEGHDTSSEEDDEEEEMLRSRSRTTSNGDSPDARVRTISRGIITSIEEGEGSTSSPCMLNRSLSSHRMIPKANSKAHTPQNASFNRKLKTQDSFNPDSSNLDPLIVGLMVEFKTRASSKTIHHGLIISVHRSRDEYDIYCGDEGGEIFEGIKRFNVRGVVESDSEDEDDERWLGGQAQMGRVGGKGED